MKQKHLNVKRIGEPVVPGIYWCRIKWWRRPGWSWVERLRWWRDRTLVCVALTEEEIGSRVCRAIYWNGGPTPWKQVAEFGFEIVFEFDQRGKSPLMSEYTESDLDIIASIDDGIAPFNWRNNSSWFGGTMVKPLTDVAIAYCGANGSYFDAPNAYFVEGWEDGDCEDCKVVGIGSVPPLGDLPQSTLTEIWDEMFTPIDYRSQHE